MNVAVIDVVIALLVVLVLVVVVFVASCSLIAIAVTFEGDDVSTAYEVDAGVDDDVEVDIRFRIRRGVLLILPLCLKYAAEELLDHGHLVFGGRERRGGNLVAVAYDARGGVDGDDLLVGR